MLIITLRKLRFPFTAVHLKVTRFRITQQMGSKQKKCICRIQCSEQNSFVSAVLLWRSKPIVAHWAIWPWNCQRGHAVIKLDEASLSLRTQERNAKLLRLQKWVCLKIVDSMLLVNRHFPSQPFLEAVQHFLSTHPNHIFSLCISHEIYIYIYQLHGEIPMMGSQQPTDHTSHGVSPEIHGMVTSPCRETGPGSVTKKPGIMGSLGSPIQRCHIDSYNVTTGRSISLYMTHTSTYIYIYRVWRILTNQCLERSLTVFFLEKTWLWFACDSPVVKPRVDASDVSDSSNAKPAWFATRSCYHQCSRNRQIPCCSYLVHAKTSEMTIDWA